MYFNIFYDSYEGELCLVNVWQNWHDHKVRQYMQLLRLELKNNAILKTDNHTYYGVEDDYIIHFHMTKDEALEYACDVLTHLEENL